MKLKYIILMFIVSVACNKNNIPTYQSIEDVIGKSFSNSTDSIEIISEDSLIWKISIYRDTTISYRIGYEVSGNEISFSVKDTIREDYYNDFLDEHEFIKTYLTDSFVGSFQNINTIDAHEVTHTYEERPNDLYSSGMGYVRYSTTLTAK